MKQLKLAAGLAAVLLASGATVANAGGYIGLDAGLAAVDQESTVRQMGQALADASGNPVTMVYDKSTSIGRIFAGMNIAQGIDIEVGYLKSGDLSATYTGTAGNTAYSLNTDISASGFDVAAVSWLTENIFLKGGAHVLEMKGSFTADVSGNSETYGDTLSGTGFLLGLGYEGALSNDVNWRAAYSYYGYIAGDSDTDAHILTLGLKMKF